MGIDRRSQTWAWQRDKCVGHVRRGWKNGSIIQRRESGKKPAEEGNTCHWVSRRSYARGAASQERKDRKSFYSLIFLVGFTPESFLMTCRQCNNQCGCFSTVLLKCGDVPSREEEEKKEIEIVHQLNLAKMCHLIPIKSVWLFQHKHVGRENQAGWLNEPYLDLMERAKANAI